MITHKLTRSRRKTIAIHITKDAAVEVRAPLKMPKSDIDKFVAEKEKWIEKHLKLRGQINENKTAFSLNYGDMVLFCGKEYIIRAKEGTQAGFDGECFYMAQNFTPDYIKNIVIKTYKILASRIIKQKVGEYAKRMNVTPAGIRITNAKTRWGSCSGKNSVNFSWRLIMADDDVIDYVVVHELAYPNKKKIPTIY
jgi:predicted metal-dependent hydrolase